MPPRPKSKRTASLPVVTKHDKQVATRPVMLLVLGPHRSGTSLTARMLECLGAENSQNQLPPQPDNPTGFFEDSDVYAFGESVFLPKIQRRWDSVSPTDWSVLSKTDRSRLGLQALEIIRRNYALSNPLSVLKEPRINNALPFWLSLLEHAGFDVRFVCVVRDPVSAARSLGKRNNFSLAHGGMIYLSAWLSVLPHLQERQVSFVQFDEIFATPGKVLGKVADKLGLPLPADFDQRLHEFTSTHLEPDLRHSSLPREDVMLEPDLPPLATELYRVLLDAAQSQNVRKTAKFVAYAERQVESLAPLLADYDAKQTRLASLQTESNTAKAECARLQSQLTDSSQQTKAALITDHDAVVAERDALRDRLSALEFAHSSLSTLHSTLIAERDSLATRHQPLATVLEDLKGQHTSLLTERDALAQERELIRSERDALAQERSNLIAERDTLVTRTSVLEAEHAELFTRHSSLVAERDVLSSDYSSLSILHSSLVAERDDLAARQASLAETTTRLASAEQELRANAARQEQERGALVRLEELEHCLEDLAARYRALVEERATLANERDRLLAQAEAARAEQESQEARFNNIEVARQELSARYSALQSAHDEMATRAADLDNLRNELIARQAEQSEMQAKLATADQALSEAQSAREKTEAGAKDTAEENEMLLNQLHQVQEELEKYFLENREIKQQREHLAASHASVIAERDGLEARISALETEKVTLSNTLDSAQNITSQLEENVATRFQELAILAREITGKDEALKIAEENAVYSGANGCQIASIELMDSVERPPHNHLNVLLRHLQFGSSTWPWVRIRLVEHHGRPGLVIFEPPGDAMPLQQWMRSGEENGMHYFLLVPENESGRQFLIQAPSTDIYVVYFLIKSLELELHKAAHKSIHPALSSDSLHAWAQIAESLRRLLEGERSRFQHGASTAKPVTLDKNKELIKVDLRDCLYSGRFMPRVSFTWEVATDSLTFERNENATLPFLEWPMARNGSAVSIVDVSFLRKQLKNRTFHQGPLASRDAEFALALAQSLPSFLIGSPAEACLAKARKFVSRLQQAACVQIASRKD